MAWLSGWYYVRVHTVDDRIFTREFQTEREARQFGNEQWKRSCVYSVSIARMGYTPKKRRCAKLIAEACKR